jgi:hypothetical protein
MKLVESGVRDGIPDLWPKSRPRPHDSLLSRPENCLTHHLQTGKMMILPF